MYKPSTVLRSRSGRVPQSPEAYEPDGQGVGVGDIFSLRGLDNTLQYMNLHVVSALIFSE